VKLLGRTSVFNATVEPDLHDFSRTTRRRRRTSSTSASAAGTSEGSRSRSSPRSWSNATNGC